METGRRVLLLDADPNALARALADEGVFRDCDASFATNAAKAKAILKQEPHLVLIADLGLDGVLEVIDFARDYHPQTVALALASKDVPAQLIIESIRRGARCCLPKPPQPIRLGEAFASALLEAGSKQKIDEHALLLEQLDQGCFISQAGRLLYANEALAVKLGRPRDGLAGMSLLARAQLDPDRHEALVRALNGEADFGPEEVSLLQPNGVATLVELQLKRADFGGRSACVGFCRDLKKGEEPGGKLTQAERLATMGSMISGIAHELNNKLAPVVACAELLEGSTLGLKDRQRVQMIASSALEAKRIVEGLLNFARQEAPRRRPFDVNGAIARLLTLPTYRFKQWGIEVSCRLEPNLPQTMADPDQIERVLINLVNNACQAMEGQGGTLSLTTRRRQDHIIIDVEDSGPGIAPENLPRVFDPFFSTKGLGKGTGLGLSRCHGIIKQHGGDIEVESAAGRTLFRVNLPLVSPAPQQVAPRKSAMPLKTRLGGRLLVVDDEDNILRVLADALGEDFDVVCAANGREAITRLAEEVPFDAVVTDLKMPIVDGMQLYGWIESNQPGLANRVIFTTGNTIDGETRAFLQGRSNPYLTKPFNLSRLLATLEHVLD
ncbi:MAG: ATP-binding protein [Pseudomonadota bacterium]